MNDTDNAMLAAFKAGEKGSDPKICEATEQIFMREGFRAIDVSKELLRVRKADEPGPTNAAGTMQCLTPESFVAAVKDHHDVRSAIFADSENGVVVCVFDYLERGGAPTHGEDERDKGWGQHRAEIRFERSRKLKEWLKLTEAVSQLSFAEFIEDHLDDVVDPKGDDLLALATDLEASSTGSFKGKVNLANGSTQLAFSHDTETTVEVPKEIALGIPLFEHHAGYRLRARLRWRHAQGTLSFRLLFPTLQDALEQEFERIVQEMEAGTGLPFYRGRLALPWDAS